MGTRGIAGEYYFFLGHIYAHIGDSTGSERFAARAIEEAERAGDERDDRQGPARAGLGGLLHGRYAEGAEHARAAVAALEQPRSGGGSATPSAGRRSTT